MRTITGYVGTTTVAVILVVALPCPAPAATHPWEEPQARVLPTGDLEWAPRPFSLVAGTSVRYIDFEEGDDTNPGDRRDAPWQHHPWDAAARGNAKVCQGVSTYVFKGGTVYRGSLTVAESGRPGDPIGLTRDPSWGEGDAVLAGSAQVTGWTRGATHPDIPDAAAVWWTDLTFAPRCVWTVVPGGEVSRIPLARTPNWTVSGADDVKSEWWHWDYKGTAPFDVFTEFRGRRLHLGIDARTRSSTTPSTRSSRAPGGRRPRRAGTSTSAMSGKTSANGFSGMPRRRRPRRRAMPRTPARRRRPCSHPGRALVPDSLPPGPR